VLSQDQYLFFVDKALDGMIGIVSDLGDDRANRRPDLPGANSPYAILTHCLGVMTYWGGQVIAGGTIERDRDAEFVATGPVDELVGRARRVRDQLAADLAGMDADAPPRDGIGVEYLPSPCTQGVVAQHIYEELAQHLGQMEITRDLVLGSG
jgi:hypothetical protein